MGSRLCWLEVAEDNSLLPSVIIVSIACDSTIPGNKATISTATHFSVLSTGHWLLDISAK